VLGYNRGKGMTQCNWMPERVREKNRSVPGLKLRDKDLRKGDSVAAPLDGRVLEANWFQ